VMAGLFEFERSLILSRTEAGIRRARELGKTFGRPPRLNAKQKRMIADRRTKGETIEELARDFEVGVATVFRALNEEK
jgi:DNA invertase Pin-like site-specific DNA recombinase